MLLYDFSDQTNSKLLDDGKSSKINWNRNIINNNDLSLIDYIEKNSHKIKKKYLSFIHDLGNQKIKNQSLSSMLTNKNGYNLWWMSLLAEKSYYKSPEIINCLKIIALEEVLKSKKIKEIFFITSSTRSSRAVELLCNDLNIKFRSKKISNKKTNIFSQRFFLKKIYNNLPFFFQSIIWFSNFLIKNFRLKLDKEQKTFLANENNNFLFVSNFAHLNKTELKKNNFYSYQWGDLNNLLKRLKIKSLWIQNYIKSQEVKNSLEAKKYLNMINEKSDSERHLFSTSFINLEVIIKIKFKLIYHLIYSLVLFNHIKKLKFSGTSSSILYLLNNDLKKSFYGSVLVENLIYIDLFDKILKQTSNKKLGIFLMENQPWEKAFIHAWRKYGHGKLIGYCHTTVNYWHLNYFDDIKTINSFSKFSQRKPDLIAVSGMLAKKNLLQFGYKKNRILEVDSLRYSYLSKLKKKSISKKNNRILILGDHYDLTTINMLNCFKNLNISLKKKFQFYFKPYPANKIVSINDKIEFLSKTNKPFNKIINNYYTIITSRSSAASLESYVIGKNVIIFLENNELNSSPLFGIKNVNYVKSQYDLEKKILKISKNKVNKSIKNYLYINPNLEKWKKVIKRFRK